MTTMSERFSTTNRRYQILPEVYRILPAEVDHIIPGFSIPGGKVLANRDRVVSPPPHPGQGALAGRELHHQGVNPWVVERGTAAPANSSPPLCFVAPAKQGVGAPALHRARGVRGVDAPRAPRRSTIEA